MYSPEFGRPDPSDDPFLREPGQPAPEVRTMEQFRTLLADTDELGTLVTLFEGDPLRLSFRAQEWMNRWCYLLRRQLALKALTLIASQAPSLRENEDLGRWIDETIGVAAWGLMGKDAELARTETTIGEPMEPRFVFLMNTLGFVPAHVRRACVSINALPDPERRAFHNLLPQRKGLGRYAREVGIDPHQARDLLKRAIIIISEEIDEEGGHE